MEINLWYDVQRCREAGRAALDVAERMREMRISYIEWRCTMLLWRYIDA